MNRKPFKAVDGPMIMLLALMIALVVQLVISIVAVGFGITDSESSGYELLNLIGMLLLQAAFISVYIIYTKKHKIVSTFSPRNKLTVWSVLAGIFVGAVSYFCFAGLAYLFDGFLTLLHFEASGIEANGALSMTLLVFATVIAAPICEETVFRSAFLSGVARERRDALSACLLSGLCFALMHMNPAQTVYQFLLGSTLAYFILKSGSVVTSILGHATSNLLAIVFSFTKAGVAVDSFYMKVSSNVLVMMLLCVLLPVCACLIFWFVAKQLHKTEKSKYPEKFSLPRIVWIDEITKQPIYEGGRVPEITDENRTVQKGFDPRTGKPVIMDRLKLQEELIKEYYENKGERSGALGKNSYRNAFIAYYAVTIAMWVITLISGTLKI